MIIKNELDNIETIKMLSFDVDGTITQIVHIGDSYSDIHLAYKKNIGTILIDYNEENQFLYDEAKVVVTEFSDIKKVLKL